MKKLKGAVARAIELWDFDLRVPAIARRDTKLGDPSRRSAQTHAESAWRRQQVRHLRTRQAAWRDTLRLASQPRALLAQTGEVLLFVIKVKYAYWGAVAGILLLWCLGTSTPISEMPGEGKAVATAFASLWLAMYVAWWMYRLRLPIKSPFLEVWRRTYDDVAASPTLKRHSR